MKNEAIARLEPLVGRWDLVLSGAWFTEEPRVEGWASFEWLDESFIVFRWSVGGEPPVVQVIGHSDANRRYQVFYHDHRGVARIFDMELEAGHWTMSREDPDFHQRFIASIDGDRIIGSWEASEDQGNTWRKDFDLTLVRQ